MIVCNLRFRRRNFRKQRALSHIREAHKPYVRYHFHFQNHGMRKGALAFLREVGRVPPRRGKPYVAFAAVAAARHKNFFAVRKHVANDFPRLSVFHQRTERHRDFHVRAALAAATVRAAAFAVARLEFRFETERKKVGHVLVSHKIDIAALTAVAAVRSARGFAFKGFERVHSVAAVARLDCNFHLVGEHTCRHKFLRINNAVQ